MTHQFTVIGGIPLGQAILVRPAGDRYRDMYGGAVFIEVSVDGVTLRIDLDSADALTFARHIELAAIESREAYAVAQRRRNHSPEEPDG